jgi:hypothetical protein
MSVDVTLTDARAWCGVPATSIDDATLQRVLDAEAMAQGRACRIDGMYPQANLEQALGFRSECWVTRSLVPRGCRRSMPRSSG